MRLSPLPIDHPDILVVDGDSDAAASLACLLTLFGHRVLVVHDGYGAIEAARRHRPRHVLLDLELPGVDGYRVAAELRADAAGPMVLIAITAQEQERPRALASGFDRFFPKPIDRESLNDLLAVLDEELRARRPEPVAPALSPADGLAASPVAEDGPLGWQTDLPVLPLSQPTSEGMGRVGIAMRASRRRVEVTNAFGLHLRAADRFVRLAQRFRSDVRVICDGRRVSGRSILDLATLAAGCGTWLELEADGPDAEEAIDALSSLVSRGFGE